VTAATSKNSTPIAVGRLAVVVLAVLALVAACGGGPRPQAAVPAKRVAHTGPTVSAKPTPKPTPTARHVAAMRKTEVAGTLGKYGVGEQELTFTRPSGQYAGQRTLATIVRYPVGSAGQPLHGPLPLVMFAPGFLQCDSTYAGLLHAWASAGYVVAAVNFPRTDCQVGAAADEADLVNQPADVSYVLSRLLTLSSQPGGWLSGLLDSHQIIAAGQSDGGDTVAALAANTCCTDHRLVAVAVLSGAEWPPMPGRYFAHGTPPMLFTQGSADTINPPWTSQQLYQSDHGHTRFYLDLYGADHMTPYSGTNSVERIVARVTVAFFDRYVLGQAQAAATMARDGDVDGAALVSGGQSPP
jgi:dienelactone hydrolase